VVRQKILEAQAAPVPALTRRDVYVPRVPRKAVAVIGIRRAGKTTFLWQLLSERAAAGMPREGMLYFNFEDERLVGLTVADLGLVLEEFYRLNPEWRDRGQAVFFLDEIQVVPQWERFARRLLDSERVELFLSGSSAKLLSREVATSMRGRALAARVFPFSFREYLRHHGREPGRLAERLLKAERSGVEKELRGYLAVGGFPEAQDLDTRTRVELLRHHVDVVLLRDVIERHKVTNPLALRWMTRHLLANAAGAFSVHRFHRDLAAQGIQAAKDTLHAYLDHLQDAFLVDTVAVAAGSVRRQQVNPRKVYPADPGLIPVFERSGRPNLGHALETCVLHELLRRGCEVSYVRTREGFEVDFLARDPEGTEHLIQVCAEPEDAATVDRELRALTAAAGEHPRADRRVLTLSPEAFRSVPEGVEVSSAAVWLLGGRGRVRRAGA
jgi:predicted AAA+ superfamily ATPase